eukprot:INCI4963.1.p2 GENE.INCI4963.1~~INCI4963.1.p2  ORF type:complete len:629 (-),score=107.45 INCI4963.1:2815-4701(-)
MVDVVAFVTEHYVVTAVTTVLGALILFLLTRGEQRLPRRFTKCPVPPEETHEEEDRAARRRFTANRLAKATPKDGFDVIVVGSGPSGLCCAASLARLGAKVCVLEQGEELGGGAHVFSLKGYEFETGVHYLGKDPGMNNMLNFATHGRLQLAPIGTLLKNGLTCYDEVRVGDDVYHFTAGIATFQKMLNDRFPEDLDKIQKFVDLVEHFRSPAYKSSAVMFFRLKAADFVPAALKPFLARTLSSTFWKSTQETAEDILRRCDVDPDSPLGSVLLGQYSDAGVRPDKLSAALYMGVVAHYIGGSTYPVGGSGALPRKMNAVIRAAGGACFVQATVNGLLMSKTGRCEGVTVEGGAEIRAKCVVNSIGALPSFQMLRPHFPKACDKAIKRLESTDEPSVAFIFLFIALDTTGQPEEERDDSSHNRWLYPSTGFTAAEKRLEEADEPWSAPAPMFVASGSAKDAGWSERYGRNRKTVVVLSQCPWKWVSQWAQLSPKQRDRNEGYQAFKKRTEEVLMEDGFRKVFPNLEKYIVFTEVGTPLTTNHFLGKKFGECYGRAAVPKHWGCQDLHPYTPCPNYYLTGQDVGTLGVAGSLASGYTTANVVAGFGQLGAALRGAELCFAAGEPAIYTQ